MSLFTQSPSEKSRPEQIATSMQTYGENYWDTYALVVNWISIRMLMTSSILFNLHTRSIDFTLAFPQADADVTIYMEIPFGFQAPSDGDYVLLLIKNLYGLKQAAKTFYEHLVDILINELEFIPSMVDPCVFYRGDLTIVTYVDDCLIFTPKKEEADALITQMEKHFSMTDEGSVEQYLGVKVERKNGSVKLSQPYLIQRIIDAIGGMQTSNVKATPAEYKQILHKDLDGPARKQNWNYRSVVGMLNYLVSCTRPDLLYSVHQCARFSVNPMLSHEQAVKRICRYLLGTKEQGLIMTPDISVGIDCFVDADFAGNWRKEDAEDRNSLLSRTGFVIFFCACPITWVSKLQTEVALSTTEAEYISLSHSMRELIPFRSLVLEFQERLQYLSSATTISCKVFEDNNGALELANKPKFRPRTKHIGIKYHHFRDSVKNGNIEVLPIDTKEQIADIFTKSLDRQTFEYLRKKLVGW